MSKTIQLIGVPTDIGAGARGASMGPEALRVAAERFLKVVRDSTIKTSGGQLSATISIGAVMIPEHDAVVAVTAGIVDMQRELDMIWNRLLPAFRESAMPGNPTAFAGLRAVEAAPHHEGLALARPGKGGLTRNGRTGVIASAGPHRIRPGRNRLERPARDADRQREITLLAAACGSAIEEDADRVDAVVNLCKRRGFVFPSSEIYGGTRSAWDYGPLVVELKENIRRQWWQSMVRGRDDVVGLDSAVIQAPQVWVASGHVGGFSDPLMDCKSCKTRHRADKLIEDSGANPAGWSFDEMSRYIKEHQIACPDCGACDFTDICKFNLMFKTFQGVTEDAKN